MTANNPAQKSQNVPSNSGQSFDELNDTDGDRLIPAMPLILHPTPFALSVHSASHGQDSGELKLSLDHREVLAIQLRRDTVLFPLSALTMT